jgi:hypothetical protein
MANKQPATSGGGSTIQGSKVFVTFGDGSQVYVSLTSFGAGAQGASLDTLASAHKGIVAIQEATLGS